MEALGTASQCVKSREEVILVFRPPSQRKTQFSHEPFVNLMLDFWRSKKEDFKRIINKVRMRKKRDRKLELVHVEMINISSIIL